MFQLVCTGTAVALPGSEDLLLLLRENHARNGDCGVTGMMLYAEGTFLHVLEGPEKITRERYDDICADTRFKNVRCLLNLAVPKREFEKWVMSFPQTNLSGNPSPSEGFSTFMDEDEPPPHFSDQPSASQEALLHFRRLSGGVLSSSS